MLVLASLVLIFAFVAAYGFTALVIRVARGSAHSYLSSAEHPGHSK
jgi:hypothetical protein